MRDGCNVVRRKGRVHIRRVLKDPLNILQRQKFRQLSLGLSWPK
jgi:hypothetical protein